MIEPRKGMVPEAVMMGWVIVYAVCMVGGIFILLASVLR